MSCATAKKEGSSRYANSIRARSTRLAGSVRERAIAPNSTKSFSPIANSIACRHAVMSSTLSANQSRKPRTHVGKCESSTYDGFHGIDVLASNKYVPGAVADHLTSSGGVLFDGDQMNILRWLEAGATASYGTVTEPCAVSAKFPQASVLVKHYFLGNTVLEAYLKSVQWPAQGLF